MENLIFAPPTVLASKPIGGVLKPSPRQIFYWSTVGLNIWVDMNTSLNSLLQRATASSVSTSVDTAIQKEGDVMGGILCRRYTKCHRDIGWKLLHHMPLYGRTVSLDHLRTASSVLGIIASGPLLGVALQAPAIKKAAARLLSKLPELIQPNELDGALYSDPEEVEKYVNDPLIYATVTPRWYTEMVDATQRVHQFAQQYRTPLYLTYGTEDAIVSTDDIDMFAKQYGGPVELKIWPGLYHEIFNEPNLDEVFNGILQWLEQQTAVRENTDVESMLN